MSLFCLACSLLALIMAPNLRRRVTNNTQTPDQNKNKKLIDLSILRNVSFLLYIASNIPTLMAVYSMYSYIPAMAENRGLRAGKVL